MVYAVELFSGNADITKALNAMPNVVCKSVDFEPRFKADLCIDVFDIRNYKHLCELLGFPRIDFIWASPDCTSYSIASCRGHIHRLKGGAPNSDYACLSDKLNLHLWRDILLPSTLYGCQYIVENPRGFYRKAFGKYAPFHMTIFYNNYDDELSLKPTDLFYSDFCFTSCVNFVWNKYKRTCFLSNRRGFLTRCKMPSRFIGDLALYVSELPTPG